jgi:WD40 repeat protein
MTAATRTDQSAGWQVQIPDVPVALVASTDTAIIAGSEGTAWAVGVATGDTRGRIDLEGGLLHASMSPSGQQVALSGPFGAWRWVLDSGAPQQVASEAWCSATRWANERRLAVAVGRRVLVLDEDGAERWRSEPFPSTVTDIAWLGEHRRIAVAAYGGVHVVEPREHGPTSHMAFKGSLLALSASPNGRWIVSGNQDASLQVFRTDKDDRLEMEGYPSKISRVAFDPSGRYLANDGAPEVSVWDFGGKGPRGRAPVLLVSTVADDVVGCFAWHPKLPVLTVGWESGEVASYRVQRGTEGRPLQAEGVLAEHTSGICALDWSPGGTSLLVADESGMVAQYSPDLGQME